MKFLRILLTPTCWIRNHGFNKSLDGWMRKALENPQFSNLTSHRVTLNGKEFWIENYPYAYAYLTKYKLMGLPSRSTVFDFADALSEYVIGVKA